ncbi:GSCFA domain-containing protein [Methylobacterium mesophilicum]
MKIAIIGNCQVHNVSRCMQVMASAVDIVPHVYGASSIKIDDLDQCDTIFIQSSYSDMSVDGVKLAERYSGRTAVWPNIYCTAFHPDLLFLHRPDGSAFASAMGDYSSSLVVFAWNNGFTIEKTKALFCESVFEQLGFYEHRQHWGRVLRAEASKCAVDLETAAQGWAKFGCFMHSPSHPKLYVASSIAELLLKSISVSADIDRPERFVADWVLDWASWPMYPDIGRRSGALGGFDFKIPRNLALPGRPVQVIGLGQFICESFERYATYPKEGVVLPDYWNRKFAGLKIPSPTRSASPYASLPPHQFWRSAVSRSDAAGFDPVVKTKFRIGPRQKISSGGSCFAQHIAQWISRKGFNYFVTEEFYGSDSGDARMVSFSAQFGNIYTAKQLLQLLRRAYGEFVPSDRAWIGKSGRYIDPFRPQIPSAGYETAAEVDAAREPHLAAVRRMFEESDLFIFTIGLTEAWMSREDGAVFPVAPGVVAPDTDSAHYEFYNFSCGEIVADLREFCQRIRSLNPNIRVLLTVSPVPLTATFEEQNAVVATSYSKSALRAAVSEVCSAFGFVDYLPSYEIITHWYNSGLYFDDDLRTVTLSGVAHVMRVFESHYLHESNASPVTTDSSNPDLAEIDAQTERAMRFLCDDELLDSAVS